MERHANFSYGVSDGTVVTNALEEGSAPPQADRYLSLSAISQQYAVINHSDSLAINGEITISSWVYRNDDGSDWRNLYDIPGAHLLEFSPSGGFDFRAENNNIDFNVNGPSIPKDTWTLITATMRKVADGQYSADVFVNGELIANAPNWQLGNQNNSSGVRSSEQDLYLGLLQSQTPWNGDPFAGGIDDFQIWNRALSTEQIKTWLYQKNTSSSASDLNGQAVSYSDAKQGSLVALYSFNSSDGVVVIDESGNGNNGSIVGAQL